MYPFAIIDFAVGGTPPIGSGLKDLVKAGQTYFALGKNGDLYVMGNSDGNGLGKTDNVSNPSTGGWTLTNTGVDEIYGNLSRGALIKKGSSFYITGWYNSFPVAPVEEQNDWRLVDPAYYTVNGYSVFDNIVQFHPSFILCSDGNIYSCTGTVVTAVADIPAGGVKWSHVSNDEDNKIIILNNGAIMAQGYNGMGKAIDATSSNLASWLTNRWKQVKDCVAGSGFEEAYTLQSRRRNGPNTTMDRYNLILAKKGDGSWWVSGTQNTGLGNSPMGTTAADNVMVPANIPNLSKVIVAEAYGYKWENVDRNWYVTHQVFVENDSLGIHKSTGDQGTCFTLANGTTPSLNSTELKDVYKALQDEGGVYMVVPHAKRDGVRYNLILSKSGKLFLTGHGVPVNTNFPAGFPVTAGNDTGPGYNLSGPFLMPDFG